MSLKADPSCDVNAQGQPEIGREQGVPAGKAIRRHADQGVGLPIHRQWFPDQIGSAAEFFPIWIARHHDRDVGVGSALGLVVKPSQDRFHAHQGKEIRRGEKNEAAPHPFVASDSGQGKRHGPDIRKDVVVLAERAKLVVGKRAVIVRRALPRGKDIDYFGRSQRDDRAQDNAVDEGEYRRVDADGDREGKNRDSGEARRLDQLPKSELEVLYHRQ